MEIFKCAPNVLNTALGLSCESLVPIGDEFTRQPIKAEDRFYKDTTLLDALVDSGTTTRCTILLNISTNTRITVILCVSAGNLKKKSIITDSQHSAETGRDYNGARMEGID